MRGNEILVFQFLPACPPREWQCWSTSHLTLVRFSAQLVISQSLSCGGEELSLQLSWSTLQ